MNELGLSLGTVGEMVRDTRESSAWVGRRFDGRWLRFDTSALGQGWKSF